MRVPRWCSHGSTALALGLVVASTCLGGVAQAAAVHSPVPVGSGSTSGPDGLYFDPSGHLWVANCNDGTVQEVTNLSGTPVVHQALNVGLCPMGLVDDHHGNLWVGNYSSGTIQQISTPDTTPVVHTAISIGTNARPTGMAVDRAGNLWVADEWGGTIDEVTNLGGAPVVHDGLTPSDGAGGEPWSVVIDAKNRLWASFPDNYSVSEISNLDTTPVVHPAIIIEGSFTSGLAFDHTGGLWVSDTWGDHAVVNVTRPASAAPNVGTPVNLRLGSSPDNLVVTSSNALWAFDEGGHVQMVSRLTGSPVVHKSLKVGSSTSNYGFRMVLSPTGNLWTASDKNGTIQEVQLTP